MYLTSPSRAAFLGTRITLRQVSPESEPIYDLIVALYAACNGSWKTLGEKTGVSEDEVDSFLEYAAQFLGNCGNYKGFGDSKFIPRISAEALCCLWRLEFPILRRVIGTSATSTPLI